MRSDLTPFRPAPFPLCSHFLFSCKFGLSRWRYQQSPAPIKHYLRMTFIKITSKSLTNKDPIAMDSFRKGQRFWRVSLNKQKILQAKNCSFLLCVRQFEISQSSIKYKLPIVAFVMIPALSSFKPHKVHCHWATSNWPKLCFEDSEFDLFKSHALLFEERILCSVGLPTSTERSQMCVGRICPWRYLS